MSIYKKEPYCHFIFLPHAIILYRFKDAHIRQFVFAVVNSANNNSNLLSTVVQRPQATFWTARQFTIPRYKDFIKITPCVIYTTSDNFSKSQAAKNNIAADSSE